MSLEVLQEIQRCFLVAGFVSTGVSFVLFFRFQIWKIVAQLSGLHAKREIRAITKQERSIKNDGQDFFEENDAKQRKHVRPTFLIAYQLNIHIGIHRQFL